MKPAFALSFSATGISLHHHSDEDWFCVGEIALDAPDLKTQIRALRDKGFALENDLSCRVIIPQDQVRFMSTATDGMDTEDSARKAMATLADATPYAAEELAFDTAIVGNMTFVAAVTRQTLDEARDFAVEHGFIPVQFGTVKDGQDFPTDPLFDASAPDASATATATVEDDQNALENADPSAQDAPTVHAIADTTAPDTFRSAPVTGSDKTPEAAPEAIVKRYTVPAAAAVLIAGVAFGTWALIGSENRDMPDAETALAEETSPAPKPMVEASPQNVPSATEEPAPQTAEAEPEPEEIAPEPEVIASEESQPDSSGNPQQDLSATDNAILEALNVAPTVVEEVARAPETQQIPTQPGIEINVPEPLEAPMPVLAEETYLASVDNSNLSNDAVALPPVQSFDTDAPFEQVVLPNTAETPFELDERGLVTPTAEGTLNPDGIVVYLGQPSKVPPEAPVRFEQEPIQEETSDRLAGLRPKPRPGDLIERFERQQLGGRTREELAVLRPKLRPESLQQQPQVDETPTALAVVRVPRPKPRPAGLSRPSGTQTANLGSTAAIGQASAEAGSFQPKAVAPKIPSSASVARQATIDNALNLRKLNLIGVYGTPANRRALVRLPSGRYKKLKVGDRLDGGNVIAISDSELRYQKRGKNLTLKMPRG
ncbi:hypothetical protein [Ruegeria lacuscaerulensis]|uniref:hypothetical protein n=1 Tax=Ruegeria lacuscaerulensis TaxID=55218 RepID=UPI00147E2728|nr:hypothetical protein [Ruegeria lacuscaerulensis]